MRRAVEDGQEAVAQRLDLTASVPGQSAADEGVVIVEELANLAALPDGPFHFVALPLRLTALDGSPVRAVAVVG